MINLIELLSLFVTLILLIGGVKMAIKINEKREIKWKE